MTKTSLRVVPNHGGELVGFPNFFFIGPQRTGSTWLHANLVRHSGIPEAVEDGVNGMLVDHAEASLVANAISQVARNPGQAQSMSQAARQTVVDRFSTESCIAELESCYREAMVHG